MCMSFVAVGKSLRIVSYVAFKMAALWFWTMFNFNPPIAHCHPLIWGEGILVDHWSTISSCHCMVLFSNLGIMLMSRGSGGIFPMFCMAFHLLCHLFWGSQWGVCHFWLFLFWLPLNNIISQLACGKTLSAPCKVSLLINWQVPQYLRTQFLYTTLLAMGVESSSLYISSCYFALYIWDI